MLVRHLHYTYNAAELLTSLLYASMSNVNDLGLGITWPDNSEFERDINYYEGEIKVKGLILKADYINAHLNREIRVLNYLEITRLKG